MFIDFVIIAIICYGLIHLDRQANCLFGLLGIGGEGIWAIDGCKDRKLRAPFKYRALTFWVARFLGITSKHMHTVRAINGRTCDTVFSVDSTGSEPYFVYKYVLLFLANLSCYWYLSVVGLPALIGCFILDIFIAISYRDDKTDYLYEIVFTCLFLVAMFSNAHWAVLFLIALLSGLNRETGILLPGMSLFYSDFFYFVSTSCGFLIGFAIPRYIYRKPIDAIDANYYSGFRFLTFNPIHNWRYSIWPHLKRRYIGDFIDQFEIHYKDKVFVPHFDGRPLYTYVKERFMHRFSAGVAFIVMMFVILLSGLVYAPKEFSYMIYVSMVFIMAISLPADVREVRVYAPVYVVLAQMILYLS